MGSTTTRTNSNESDQRGSIFEAWSERRKANFENPVVKDRRSTNAKNIGHTAPSIAQYQLTGKTFPTMDLSSLDDLPSSSALISKFIPHTITELLTYCLEANLCDTKTIRKVLNEDNEALLEVTTCFIAHCEQTLKQHCLQQKKRIFNTIGLFNKQAAKKYDSYIKDYQSRLWGYSLSFCNAPNNIEEYGEHSQFVGLRLIKDEAPDLTEIPIEKIANKNQPALMNLITKLCHQAEKHSGTDVLNDIIERADLSKSLMSYLQANSDILNQLKELDIYNDNYKETLKKLLKPRKKFTDINVIYSEILACIEYDELVFVEAVEAQIIMDRSKLDATFSIDTNNSSDLEQFSSHIMNEKWYLENQTAVLGEGIDADLSSNAYFGIGSLISFGTTLERESFSETAEMIMSGSTEDEASVLGIRANLSGIERLKIKATAELILVALLSISEESTFDY